MLIYIIYSIYIILQYLHFANKNYIYLTDFLISIHNYIATI